MTREPYPIGLSIASALVTSLGLCAGALGVRWGTAPPPGDALPLAWLYVHVLWMVMTLAIWPAVALRAGASPGGQGWQWGAISAGAIPAVALAGFLSSVNGAMVLSMLCLQAGAGLLALGLLRLQERHKVTGQLAAVGLAAAVFMGPVVAFLWDAFLPESGFGWLPLMAVAHAAHRSAAVWGVTGLYAGLGLALAIGAGKKRSPRREAGGESLT